MSTWWRLESWEGGQPKVYLGAANFKPVGFLYPKQIGWKIPSLVGRFPFWLDDSHFGWKITILTCTFFGQKKLACEQTQLGENPKALELLLRQGPQREDVANWWSK